MSILNKLIPKHILETNLKRLEKFFNLEEEYSPIDQMVDYYIDDQKVDHKTFSHDPWFEENVPYPYDGVVENPDESDEIEEETTMHEKMYQLATQSGKHTVGGSEACHGSGHHEEF